MPTLANQRHELFAQEVAKGSTAIAAYEAAGYRPDRGAAARLSANVNIQERVSELLSKAAAITEITVAGITDRLIQIADKGEKLAEASGLSVARAALMDAAKLNGLVVDTTEKISRSPEERAARLAALKAERERLASIH